MMPEMNGLDVLRALRANPRFKDLPVVMFSALSDPAIQREALRAGAQAFIVKGHFDDALAAVQKYVGVLQ
jgi:CheY-like chemotaxis protein